jgi:hypothetical protein
MNDIINFIPEKSAEILKEKLLFRNKLSLEIVIELHKAREYYSNQGFRSDLTSKSNISKLNTFSQYCDFIGLYRQKANNWLERYIPEQNKLLTFEELQQKKQLEFESKKSEAQKKQEQRIKQLREDEKEFYYNYKIGIDINYDDSDKNYRWGQYKKSKEYMEKEKEKIKEKNEDAKDNYYQNIINEAQNYLNNSVNDLKDRDNIKNKIGMSINDDSKFIDALDDYLQSLKNNNIRLNALHNIIKYCKAKVNEYQVKSQE